MRCFVAIAVPEGPSRALEAVQDGLKLGRLTDPDQFHLTLAFLGEVPDAEVEAAHDGLALVRGAPFELQLAGLGCFGNRDARALWAGVADRGPVAALAERVRSALYGMGVVLERRRFRPHVTLARLSGAEARDEAAIARTLALWDGFPAPAFTVDRFSLYRSTLTKGGAIHDALADYELG